MTIKPIYKSIRKIYIYKIVCNKTGEVYIGSTLNTIKRKCEHKQRKSCASNQIINRNDWSFIVIETFNTKFKLIQLLKEKWYLDTIPNINMKRALTVNNMRKNIKKISDKKYRVKNIDKINVQRKAHYQLTKDEKRDEKNARNRLYRKENKERLSLKLKEKYTCICGCKIRRDSKSKHERSLKHLDYIKKLKI